MILEGIVFDIGRGAIRSSSEGQQNKGKWCPISAFGSLWEVLGKEILGEELAVRFDESFVQPLDNNDNTGEKNELATLIGNFNPSWDANDNGDKEFFQAVSVAGMIL